MFSSKRATNGPLKVLIAALLAIVAGGILGWLVVASALQAKSTTATSGNELETPAENSSPADAVTETSAASSPEQTVDEFYTAITDGEYDTAFLTFSDDLASSSEPSLFDGWVARTYQLLEVVQTEDGIAYVDVEEYDGTISNGVINYVLVLEDDIWKIDEWTVAGLGGTDGNEEYSGTDILNSDTAVATVSTFLSKLRDGDVSAMRTISTDRLRNSEPELFEPDAGALIDFGIIEDYPEGAVWVVGVREEWDSGPEVAYYIVIDQDGQVRIDELFYQ